MNEIETGNNDVKIGNNGLIEPECCFGSDCCFREPVPCFVTVSGKSPLCSNPPLCSRHTNQPWSAGPIGPCSAPDAILNPPHLTHHACAWLVSGCFPCIRRPRAIWRARRGTGPGTNNPSQPPPHWTSMPRRHRRPMPLHRPSWVLRTCLSGSQMEAWTLFDKKNAEKGRRSGRGQCHQACSNRTNQKQY